MRSILSVLLILFLVFSLTGCLGENESIEELLSAPSLSNKQTAVMSALQQGLGDHISFVYPSTGESRAAVQIIDLDDDGVQEAIVFYKDTSSGINASVAVLEMANSGAYVVASTTEGLGDGIQSCRFLRMPGTQGRYLLMEWSSQNLTSNSLAVYSYVGNTLELGFEEKCTNLTVIDNASGSDPGFCYLTVSSDIYSLKYVELSSSHTSTVQSVKKLDTNARGVKQLSVGQTQDGPLIFVDEITDSGYQTEVFSYTSSTLTKAVSAEGYSDTAVSKRSSLIQASSTSIDSLFCFPSEVIPFSGVLSPESWLYWYTVSENAPALQSCGYYSSSYGYYLSIPFEWLKISKASVFTDAPGTLIIHNPDTGESLIRIAALSIDENASGFTSSGYELLASSGAYRYYALFECSEEEKMYIKNRFIIF